MKEKATEREKKIIMFLSIYLQKLERNLLGLHIPQQIQNRNQMDYITLTRDVRALFENDTPKDI